MAVLFQVLEKLGQLQIQIECKAGEHGIYMKFESDKLTIASSGNYLLGYSDRPIEAFCQVSGNLCFTKTATLQREDCIVAKIPLSNFERPHPSLCSPLTGLTCRHCKTSLSETKFTVKSLPHESWHELIDCWSCHKAEFAQTYKESLLLPSSHDVILESPMDILVMKDATRIADNRCPDCKTVIGEYMTNSVLKISKFHLDPFQLEDILFSKMWHSIHYNSQFQFRLTDGARSLPLKVLHSDIWAGFKGLFPSILVQTCEVCDPEDISVPSFVYDLLLVSLHSINRILVVSQLSY